MHKNPWESRLSNRKKALILIKEAENDLKNDKTLIPYEILVNEAHTIMLYRVGILEKSEASAILKTLEKLYDEWISGNMQFNTELEDIHFHVESYLINKLGIRTGGKLHTGRSRNDLIATDIRLYLRDAINQFSQELLNAMKKLLDIAESNIMTIIPGYTHMQQAQPITLSHYLIAHVNQLMRTYQRLREAYKRVNLSPLGSGALAGVNWSVDREMAAQYLGFSGIIENSLDAITSRGEIEAEILSDLAILSTQLSRIAEDIIFWASQESRLIELDDSYAGISSIMPQKKNPEAAEIVRAKSSELYGNLVKALTVMKGLPTGYNKDMQELKGVLEESFEITKLSLQSIVGMIETMRINSDVFINSPSMTYTLATDIADILVKKLGISFREAHQVVASAVKRSQDKGLTIEHVISSLNEELGIKIYELPGLKLDPKMSINMKISRGSTSPSENMKMLNRLKKTIIKERDKLNSEIMRINESLKMLMEDIKKIMTLS
ncbi:MAG: argininosuccinate lyase [Thermoprotei archaeon]